MTSEHAKGAREVAVFEKFLDVSGLAVERVSVEKRDPPEPDIYCIHATCGRLAVELVELCDPNIAQLVARARKGRVDAIWTSDPTAVVLKKKLLKRYETRSPIYLVLYSDGRFITPDELAIATLQRILETRRGVFDQAWFLGSSGAHLLWRSDS